MRAVDAGDIDRCLAICIRFSSASFSVRLFRWDWSVVDELDMGEVGLSMTHWGTEDKRAESGPH